MNALLLISHGSRRSASNDEVLRLTETLRTKSGEEQSLVACAFLEMAEPTIQTALDQLAADGATAIQVFPHFLAAGTHVTKDIPRELDAAAQRHPGVTFTLLPHLGALPGLADLILAQLPRQPIC
jgi:sirohydrochlorin ferrochelatase